MNVENLDLEFNLGEIVVDESGDEFEIMNVVESMDGDVQYRYARREDLNESYNGDFEDVLHKNVSEMEDEFRALEGTYCPVCYERCVAYNSPKILFVGHFMGDRERFECVNDDCELDTFSLQETQDDYLQDGILPADEEFIKDEISRIEERYDVSKAEAVRKALESDNNLGDRE